MDCSITLAVRKYDLCISEWLTKPQPKLPHTDLRGRCILFLCLSIGPEPGWWKVGSLDTQCTLLPTLWNNVAFRLLTADKLRPFLLESTNK